MRIYSMKATFGKLEHHPEAGAEYHRSPQRMG